MRYLSILAIILLILTSGCNKSDDNSKLTIWAGFECGWGLGIDSLYISESVIRYVYYVPSRSPLPQINVTRKTGESEWAELVGVVNPDNFVKLDYNTCNICFDGCDEWISIQNDRIYHKIRFSKGLKIPSIDNFQTKLEQLRSEFSK